MTNQLYFVNKLIYIYEGIKQLQLKKSDYIILHIKYIYLSLTANSFMQPNSTGIIEMIVLFLSMIQMCIVYRQYCKPVCIDKSIL